MLRFVTKSFLKPLSTSKYLQSVAWSTVCPKERIAVVLSGCGVYDGSEIQEAVHIITHLTRNNATPVIFAPDMPQKEIINHIKGTPEPGVRGVMEESSRISRGKINPLSELAVPQNAAVFNAVIFPGGFGVAKNLSDFATRGIHCTVHPDVVKVLNIFHKERKPIGLACIAPILAARVLCNVTITFGKDSCEGWPHRAVIEQAKLMGAIVESRDYLETSYDTENEIYSTPAYMYDGKPHEIADGLEIFVKYILVNMRKGDKKKQPK